VAGNRAGASGAAGRRCFGLCYAWLQHRRVVVWTFRERYSLHRLQEMEKWRNGEMDDAYVQNRSCVAARGVGALHVHMWAAGVTGQAAASPVRVEPGPLGGLSSHWRAAPALGLWDQRLHAFPMFLVCTTSGKHAPIPESESSAAYIVPHTTWRRCPSGVQPCFPCDCDSRHPSHRTSAPPAARPPSHFSTRGMNLYIASECCC
jgi:hypothetical protein